MSQEEDDDFLNIISSNNLDGLQSESELYNMTVRDLIVGLRNLAEATMIVSDFIDAYFMSVAEEIPEDDRPALSPENIVFAKTMFESAVKFAESIIETHGYEGDDDDEDDDDEDESDEDDE